MLQEQKNPNFNKLDTAFLAGWKAAKEYFTSFMTEVEAPQIDGGEFSLLKFNDFLASLEKTYTKEDLENAYEAGVHSERYYDEYLRNGSPIPSFESFLENIENEK